MASSTWVKTSAGYWPWSCGATVGPAGSRGRAFLRDLNVQFVHLAVADRGGETDHILAMQLLRDPGERRAQFVAVF